MKLILALLIMGSAFANPHEKELCAKLDVTNGQCLACWSGFLKNGICYHAKLVVNYCLSYSFDGFCKKCEPGYYVDQTGKCINITANSCAVYDIMSSCLYCDGSRKPINGSCENTSKCITSNCLYCGSNDVCVQCQASYSLTSIGTCVAAKSTSDNCELRTENGCQLCKFGYFDHQGGCIESKMYRSSAYLISSALTICLLAIF